MRACADGLTYTCFSISVIYTQIEQLHCERKCNSSRTHRIAHGQATWRTYSNVSYLFHVLCAAKVL